MKNIHEINWLYSSVAGLNSDRNLDRNRLNVNGNNWNDNRNGYAFGMALAAKIFTMIDQNIYQPAEDSFFMSDVLRKIIPSLLKQNKDLVFLEVGCGSGIQLQTALNSGIKKKNIFSCDINKNSVEYCRSLGFNSVYSNLFKNIKQKYDLIIFNPPYLPREKIEPKSSQIATTGGKKGGELINKFLKQAREHLNKNGKIILLVSSLTKGIYFNGYNKKIIANKKIFFEELAVMELSLTNKN